MLAGRVGLAPPIRLINNDVTLTTNYLDYNRTTNIAYYYGGGTMVNRKENNTLTSDEGYYHASSESFYFKNVKRI